MSDEHRNDSQKNSSGDKKKLTHLNLDGLVLLWHNMFPKKSTLDLGILHALCSDLRCIHPPPPTTCNVLGARPTTSTLHYKLTNNSFTTRLMLVGAPLSKVPCSSGLVSV